MQYITICETCTCSYDTKMQLSANYVGDMQTLRAEKLETKLIQNVSQNRKIE